MVKKYINDLKKLMYHGKMDFNARCAINDVIFEYDKYRAKSEVEVMNAGKQHFNRLQQLCDYLAKNDL